MIRAALAKVRCYIEVSAPEFKKMDLLKAGLIGERDSANRRNQVGKILGIGYANGKQLLNRLNGYGISRDEFEAAVKKAGALDE